MLYGRQRERGVAGMKNRIISRYYVAADIVLASPLSLSGGDGEHTDSDVMRDGEGRLLLPGSSVAGAFRAYMGQRKDEAGIFGYAGREEVTGLQKGYMSALLFSDTYFDEGEGKAVVSERDGVSLSEEKTVENKFDYEIIETGAKARMYIEKVCREKDGEKGIQRGLREIQLLLSALDKGEIRFGSRKNSGCGWIKVEKAYKYVFGMAGETSGTGTQSQEVAGWRMESDTEMPGQEEAERWMAFCTAENPWEDSAEWKDWKIELPEQKYISIEIPLRLTGGISIRKYSTRPEVADFEHMTVHGSVGKERIPVIPGSSWKGAVRSCAKNILRELGIPDIQEKIDEWFGMVKDNTKSKQPETQAGSGKNIRQPDSAKNTKWIEAPAGSSQNAKQSMVVIKESQLTGSVLMSSTRNRVNRFDASTVDGALYTENAYFGGRTTLRILVRKTEEYVYAPLLGLLSLVVQEIEEGYLAIGGQSAVGRGIFESDINEAGQGIQWSEEIDRHKCLAELASLKGGR